MVSASRRLSSNYISLWRIVFTYAIIMLHLFDTYGIRTYWYISVEFFFIVSGWLLAKDLDEKNRTPYEFTWHRLKRLYPEYFFSLLICACFLIADRGFSLKESIAWFSRTGIYEFTVTQFWLWDNGEMANVAIWYVSVLVIAGLLIYALGKYLPDISKYIIFPIAIIEYVFISYTTEDVSVIGNFLHFDFLRGFAEMSLGFLLYNLNLKTDFFKKTICKKLGFLSLCFVVIASSRQGGTQDFIYILLISFGVLTSFNTELTFGKKLILSGDNLSYSIFLNHIVFREYIMPRITPVFKWYTVLVYVLLVTVFSLCMHYFVQFIVKKIDNCLKECK